MKSQSVILGENKSKIARSQEKRSLLKVIGSLILAIIASSHHWVHTLLIALGLTTLGTGLISLSPWVKIMFMLTSLLISIWMIRIAWRKRNHRCDVSWVYFISSILSIIIVLSSLPQVMFRDSSVQQNQPEQNQQENHQQHH